MEEQKLREKIAHILYLFGVLKIGYQEAGDQILVLFKEAGYVELADDQRFPQFIANSMALIEEYAKFLWTQGWRKMKLEVKDGKDSD